MVDLSFHSAASSILKRGVELDIGKRYTEALVCYQEGLQILITSLKGINEDQKKQHIRKKIEEYMSRAETLKQHIETTKESGSFHEQVKIENNSHGHSYEAVFGRFLDAEVIQIDLEDPYIRTFHQCQNLVRFCELVKRNCPSLKCLNLLTTEENQIQFLEQIKENLRGYNIKFNYSFSQHLHDRQIKLNTGWIIKIGRGLDYFKAPENKFSLGVFDLNLRACHETTVDIFHQKDIILI